MKLTSEELQSQNETLRSENASLKEQINQLMAQIADLKSKINKNSKNSSNPPSLDPKSNEPQKPEKPGKRPYHPGATRALLPESAVTSITQRKVDVCPNCSGNMELTGKVTKHQQIELPEIKPLVHQIELHTCKCLHCNIEVTPELEAGEQYLLGPRFEGLVNLCLGQFRMGHQPVRQFIATLLPQVDLSQGLISKIKKRMAKALSAAHEEIITAILESGKPLHCDATGWRHMGVNEHAIVMRVNQLVAYEFVRHQNKRTISKLLNKRNLHVVVDRGLAISELDCKIRQYCLAHILRNLKGLAEHMQTTVEEAQKIGEIHDKIQLLFHDKHQMDQKKISVSTWRQYGLATWREIEDMVEEVLNANPSKKVARFFRRIQKDYKHLKAYLKDPDYPMTNNSAEEALRTLVIARKLCFGSRSEYGRSWRARIQSCIETLRRRGQSVLDFLADAIHAYRHNTCSPTILESVQ